MKKALIIYHSRTGITKRFAEEINEFLVSKNIDSKVFPVGEPDMEEIKNCDLLFLGCWTNGLMILFQHPGKAWGRFANKLPDLTGKKIILFTTYKMAVGSMFKKMKEYISCHADDILMELKSRNGHLSGIYKGELEKIITYQILKEGKKSESIPAEP